MAKFVCVDKCFMGGSLYRKGQIAEFDAKEVRHFARIGTDEAQETLDAPKGQPADIKPIEAKPVGRPRKE